MLALLTASLSNGVYEKGGDVVLYANKVGPFANPNEVYAFYSLPYCAPTEIETKRENMGALLKGDRPTKTRYDLKFLGALPLLPSVSGRGRAPLRADPNPACRAVDVPWKSLCKVQLGDVEAAKFKQAIVDDYYFEMLLGAPAASAHVCDTGA